MESQPKVIREIANIWILTGIFFGIIFAFCQL